MLSLIPALLGNSIHGSYDIAYEELSTNSLQAKVPTFSLCDASEDLNKTYIIWSNQIFPENLSMMIVDMSWIWDLTGDDIPEIAYMLSDNYYTYLFIINGANGEILHIEKFYTSYSSVSAIILNSSYVIFIENNDMEHTSCIKLLRISSEGSRITVNEVWSKSYNDRIDNVVVYNNIFVYHGCVIECISFDYGTTLWNMSYMCFYGLFTIVGNLVIVPYQVITVDPYTNETYYNWYIDVIDISGNPISSYYLTTEDTSNVGWFALKLGGSHVILVRFENLGDSYKVSFKVAYITESDFIIRGGYELGTFDYQEYSLFGVTPSWKVLPLRPIVDANGDGIPEILGVTKNGLAVFNGYNGNLMFYVKYKGVNLSTKYGLLEPIITSDLTNDGVNDIWVPVHLDMFLVGISEKSAHVIYEISEATDNQIKYTFIARGFLDLDNDLVGEIVISSFLSSSIYCIWGSYDNSSPEIIDFTPKNLTVTKPGVIKFKVNCHDKSGIDSAYIVLNDIKIPLQYDNLANQYVCSCLLYEGEYSWKIVIRDKVGFETVLESIILYVDETPPSIIVNNPKNYSVITTPNVTISWIILEEHLSKTEIRIDSGEWITLYNVTEYNSTFTSGFHSVEIRAIDDAGNSEAVKVFFYVDLSAPDVIVLSSNNTKISETLFNLKWEASDDCGISYFEIKIDNLPWMNVGNNTSLTIPLWEGTHVIYIKAVDIANKTTVAKIIVTVQLMHMEFAYIGIAWIASLVIAIILVKKSKK